MAQASDELAPESDLPSERGAAKGQGRGVYTGVQRDGGKVRGQVRKS